MIQIDPPRLQNHDYHIQKVKFFCDFRFRNFYSNLKFIAFFHKDKCFGLKIDILSKKIVFYQSF